MSIASGTWGTCSWEITDAGTLVIGDGTLGLNPSGSVSGVPWYANRLSITAVEFGNVISSEESCMGLLYQTKIENVDLTTFDTSNSIDMSNMFFGCESLKAIQTEHMDTSKVESMYNMFSNCLRLQTLDLSSFDTSNVVVMSGMFVQCNRLTSLDLSTFDTSSVVNMENMFYNCQSLLSLDISNFDTPNVTTMLNMFRNCLYLTSLDVSRFDTSNVTKMANIFAACTKLNNISLGTKSIFSAATSTPTTAPPSDDTYTGQWTGGGSTYASLDSVISQYDGTKPGTYRWEKWKDREDAFLGKEGTLRLWQKVKNLVDSVLSNSLVSDIKPVENIAHIANIPSFLNPLYIGPTDGGGGTVRVIKYYGSEISEIVKGNAVVVPEAATGSAILPSETWSFEINPGEIRLTYAYVRGNLFPGKQYIKFNVSFVFDGPTQQTVEKEFTLPVNVVPLGG